MGNNWGDIFAEAFSGSYESAAERKFRKFLEDEKLRERNMPPVMPDLSSLFGKDSGIGLTGADINPMTGSVSLNYGQTPEAKAKLEEKQKQEKEMQTATQDWKGGKAFLNRIKDIWLETKPPKTGVLGIGGSGVLPQPLYGAQQALGSYFQFTQNQKKDRLYSSYVGALKSRLAKGGIIGKDVGNLSVQEQQWVMNAVPAHFDYEDVGLKKIDNMTGMLDEMYQARKEGYKSLEDKMADKGWKYFNGQIITKGKKSYRVIGGDLTNDPDVEEIK